MSLSPDSKLTPDDVARGKKALLVDAAFASLAGSLYGGVILVGFALAIGASPFHIGVLAALPLIAQAAQLPAIALVERIRQRRKIAVISVSAARLFIFALALIPYASPATRLAYLIAAEFMISVLGSIGGCALNSWLHQFLPRQGLGEFLSRRLFWGTALASAGALGAGSIVDRWPFGERLDAYSLIFAVGALAILAIAFGARPAIVWEDRLRLAAELVGGLGAMERDLSAPVAPPPERLSRRGRAARGPCSGSVRSSRG